MEEEIMSENWCIPKLTERPLLDTEDAEGLSETFKILSNGTRLRILHTLLRTPNASVSEVAEQLEMKPQAISNQLQRLVDKGIVRSIREANLFGTELLIIASLVY